MPPWLDPDAVPAGGWVADCILYLRLSDARNENGSFVDRAAALRERAWHRRWRVVRVVEENDAKPDGSRKPATAFKRKRVKGPDGSPIKGPDGEPVYRVWRPGFRSILADLSAGRAQAVLAEDLDRAMRDPRDLEDLIDVCERHRCSADSLSGSLKFNNGGTDAEITLARVMVAMGNKAIRDTARRVAAARKRQAENGEWHGGKRPFGFEPGGLKVKTVERVVDGTAPSDDEVIGERTLASGETVTFRFTGEAAEIINAADAILAGVSLRQAALDLRRREVPTVKGTRWTAETLKDILVRPRNAGIMVYRPETERGRSGAGNPRPRYYTPADEVGRAPWVPILQEDVWRAVVAKLVDPSRTAKAGAPFEWLGSGIYLCPCGSGMRGRSKGGAVLPIYQCRASGMGDKLGHTSRQVPEVDRLVVDAIIERLSRPDVADLVETPASDPAVDLNAVRGEVAKLRQRKADLSDAFAEEEIDRAQLASGTRRLDAKLAKAEAMLTAHTERSPLTPLIGVKDVRAVWNGMSLGAQREVVKRLVTVTILPSPRQGRGPFRPDSVTIVWRSTTQRD